jgi:hypothetical protein
MEDEWERSEMQQKETFSLEIMREGTTWKSLRINNQQDASSIQNFVLSRNSTCFGHLLCLSSGVISCTNGS